MGLGALAGTIRYPEHSAGHLLMLTGRSQIARRASTPASPSRPTGRRWPRSPSAVCPPRNNLPPAVVLPEVLIHREGRVIPGQFAGEMGAHRNPMFVTYARFSATAYGAWPEYGFHHARGRENPKDMTFQGTEPVAARRAGRRAVRRAARSARSRSAGSRRRSNGRPRTRDFDRYRQKAISLLADRQTQQALSTSPTPTPSCWIATAATRSAGRCLMARQLVEAGVSMVQVNLGNNETWDTHGNAFPHLKDYLFPPTDRAVSALLDDLHERGLLESTLIVMAGEFGRTPKISTLPQLYAKPGRDHWGTQTVFFAGGGVRGGTVIGSTDKNRRLSGGQSADAREHGGHDLPGAGHSARAGLARCQRSTALRLPRRSDRGADVSGAGTRLAMLC